MALREIIADFRTRFQTGPIARGVGFMQRATRAVFNLRNLLIGSALFLGAKRLGSAMADWAKDVTDQGDKLAKTAKQLGFPAEQLQAWQVAGQFAGASAEEVTNAFIKLQKAAADSGDGMKTSADAFKRLGVDYKESNGELKSGPALMRELADGLRGVENSSERVQIAQALMGRSGSKLIPLLTQDAEALDAALRELDELGGGFSADMAQSAEDAADANLRWELSTRSLKTQMVAGFLPMVTSGMNKLAKFGGSIANMVKGTNAGKTALILLGGTIAAVMAATMLPLLPVIVAFAILFLIVEDLVTMFSGGKSVVGDFLDKTFGIGTTAKVIEKAKAAWEKYKGQIVETGKAVAVFIVTASIAIIQGTIKMIAAFMNFKNRVTFAIDDISARFQSFAAQIRNIPTEAQQAGEQLVDGLIAGIEAKWEALKAKVKGLGKMIDSAFREATDSHSPSRMMVRNAVDLGRGAIVGFAEMAPKVAKAALSLVPDVSGAGAFSGGGVTIPNRVSTVAVSQTNHLSFNGISNPQGIADAVNGATSQGLAAERRSALEAVSVFA